MIRRGLAQMQLALLLLTRLPAGRLPDPAPGISAAIWAFPLAGAVLGTLAAAVYLGAVALGLPLALAAGLALGAQVALSGGLHEDGLADTADGLWGGQTIARRLEIMRDSRIGSYGVLALILSLGLRWQALIWLGGLAPEIAALALVVLAMTSRVAPAALLLALPPARDDGLGRAAQGATGAGLTLAGALAFGAGALLLPWPALLALLCVQGLVTLALAGVARRKLGGQTGDILGAGQQLAEVAGYLALAAMLAG